MCGRYFLYSDGKEIKTAFSTQNSLNIMPIYNVIPSTESVIIKQDKCDYDSFYDNCRNITGN